MGSSRVLTKRGLGAFHPGWSIVTESPHSTPPLALAMEWVARIFAVALLMVLPGLGGQWADQRFGTSFLALIGILVGVTVGITVLLIFARNFNQQSGFRQGGQDNSRSNGESD